LAFVAERATVLPALAATELGPAMIAAILIVLAIAAGVGAVACGAASGIAMASGDQGMKRFAAAFAFGLLAVALALMWWAA
jgi:hypothetical protein